MIEILRIGAKLALYAALGSFLTALGFLGNEIYVWMRTGAFAHVTTESALTYLVVPYPQLHDWRGIQKIIDWILELPLWMSCAALTILFLYVGLGCYEAAYKREQSIKAQERRKHQNSSLKGYVADVSNGEED